MWVTHQATHVHVCLETRMLRGDQIEVFKILNGYEIMKLLIEIFVKLGDTK